MITGYFVMMNRQKVISSLSLLLSQWSANSVTSTNFVYGLIFNAYYHLRVTFNSSPCHTLSYMKPHNMHDSHVYNCNWTQQLRTDWRFCTTMTSLLSKAQDSSIMMMNEFDHRKLPMEVCGKGCSLNRDQVESDIDRKAFVSHGGCSKDGVAARCSGRSIHGMLHTGLCDSLKESPHIRMFKARC